MRGRRAVALGVAAAALIGCDATPPPTEAPPVALPSPMPTGVLMARTRAQVAQGYAYESLAVRYGRADGTLDPAYGEFEAVLVRLPGVVADDPARPLGAPPPTPTETMSCRDVTFDRRGLRDGERSMCFTMGTPVARLRCTPDQIWQRAIADGAPAAALATVTFRAAMGATWTFTIDDEPRAVHVYGTYPDDCAPVVEAPAP
ncbi:MAG: hypothetical protein R2939_20045 [Kofleriaceae bacterium]